MGSIQSSRRMLTFLVARTLWPHLGQISLLRVLLGCLPPGVVPAPAWAAQSEFHSNPL